MAEQKIVARGQISIVDLNDARALSLYLMTSSPTTQIYNPDTTSYTPSWEGGKPLVITPQLSVSGLIGDQISQIDKDSISYTINNKSISELGWATVSQTAPYSLTITRDMRDFSQMKVQFSATYTDKDFSELQTPVRAELQFNKILNAGSSIVLLGDCPKGFTFYNENEPALIAHCDMWRGSQIDSTDVEFKWYKRENGVWTQIVPSKNFGCTTPEGAPNELHIPNTAVLNYEVFKCVAKDLDKTVATYNSEVSCVFEFFDKSDPYEVDITSDTGSIIRNGVGQTVLMARIWRAGVCLSSEEVSSKFDLLWNKFDQNGNKDVNWRKNDLPSIKRQSVTVDASEIQNKAVFTCDVFKKAQ